MAVFDNKKQMPVMPTTINNGTKLEGDIQSDADIRLDGQMTGMITTKAKVVVGVSGTIEGDIECLSADISGTVTGRIDVRELLFLKSTAVVTGDITTSKLVVENGAKFNGSCQMNSNAAVKQASISPKSVDKNPVTIAEATA